MKLVITCLLFVPFVCASMHFIYPDTDKNSPGLREVRSAKPCDDCERNRYNLFSPSEPYFSNYHHNNQHYSPLSPAHPNLAYPPILPPNFWNSGSRRNRQPPFHFGDDRYNRHQEIPSAQLQNESNASAKAKATSIATSGSQASASASASATALAKSESRKICFLCKINDYSQ